MRSLFFAALLALFPACYSHEGSPISGPEMFGCDGADYVALEAVLDAAVEVMPSIREIAERTDWICEPAEILQSNSPNECGFGRTPEQAASIECCTLGIGSSSPLSGFDGATILVLDTTGPVACATHEPQHWQPDMWQLPDACASHDTSCGWNEAIVDHLNAVKDSVE